MEPEESESGDAWADILARRSPEGRGVVDELYRAEEAVLAIQKRVMHALSGEQECPEDYAAFEVAMAEVDRMREWLARQ